MLHLQKICVFLISAFLIEIVNCVQDKFPVPFEKLATCREFDVYSKTCTHFFPFSTFKNYKSDKYKFRLKFYVMTNTDANIVFLNNTKFGPTTLDYTIVIAANANTHSWIRRNGVNVGVDSHKTNILSFLWPTPITITLSNCDVLEVSIPNVIEPILKVDAKDIDYSMVCLYAWNADSRWFYNCDEEEDAQLNPTKT